MTRPPLGRGTCHWCRCVLERACPGGCAWANVDETLCTQCVDVEIAWRALPARQVPSLRRSFFRGFMAGSQDARATEKRNPYETGGKGYLWWERGHRAGVGVAADRSAR